MNNIIDIIGLVLLNIEEYTHLDLTVKNINNIFNLMIIQTGGSSVCWTHNRWKYWTVTVLTLCLCLVSLQVWFKNRRARRKRQRTGGPPTRDSLLPTALWATLALLFIIVVIIIEYLL